MSVQGQRHARKVQSAAVTCSILMELVDLKFKREKQHTLFTVTVACKVVQTIQIASRFKNVVGEKDNCNLSNN